MPDGSIEAQQIGLSTFGDPALEAMHLRFVDYGLCWLRGGGGADASIVRREIIKIDPSFADDVPEGKRIVTTGYRDPDPDRKPRQWSRPEIEAAGRLHSRIIRLPLVVQRITLQVFYAEDIAAGWSSIEPDAKRHILRDLTMWPTQPYGVNARLARYRRTTQDNVAPIRPEEFMAIMLRGMRILVASERMLP